EIGGDVGGTGVTVGEAAGEPRTRLAPAVRAGGSTPSLHPGTVPGSRSRRPTPRCGGSWLDCTVTGRLMFRAHRGTEKIPRSRGRGSVGRASPCQGEGRGFESRRPLGGHPARWIFVVEWPRGEATACKAVYTGSNPVSTSACCKGD